MNTNQIKKFATDARTRLLKGVVNKLKAYFDEKGRPHLEPTWVQGGCVYGEQLQDEAFYRAWQSLYKHIQLYGFRTTAEDVAYTWFNRLVAINILAKNGIVEPVLQFSNPMVRVPQIVEQARAGQFPEMSVDAKDKLNQLLNDPTKTFDQFSFLIDRYCAANPIIRKCFGSVDDFSYLLLPNNILAEGELVDMLNNSDYISDEDYRAPELIGWLYQFYISEKKDEVFAKKGKFESDEIPAATQIFTPNWIVKYMVQNSLGRIYLDTEPYSEIKSGMKYLVPAEEGGEKFTWTDVKELTCADLACGSGHILNECFDLLYDIYIEQGYSRREAVESIFAHNLLGIDIDTRAKQMAQFALLLKACKRDAAFADAHAMPRVFDMPDPYADKDRLPELLAHFFLGGTRQMIDEAIEAIELFDNAKSLGSIMKFNISPATREAIVRRLAELRAAGQTELDSLFRYLDIVLALTDRYAALVMNPPYMGGSNMNSELSSYTKMNYQEGKADLCTVFMILAVDRLAKNGKYGMVNMQNWMFLSSFETLREHILAKLNIDNVIHLGPRFFDSNSVGTIVQNVAFVISKMLPQNHSFFYRVTDGSNCDEKERIFLSSKPFKRGQDSFNKLYGSPIAYWISDHLMRLFTDNPPVTEYGLPRQGLATCDNKRFVRLWHEIERTKMYLTASNAEEARESRAKWFPYNKGGLYRKWYGNNENVINWENDGAEIVEYATSLYGCPSRTIKNRSFYFKESITWTDITFVPGFRYQPAGFIFDVTGMSYFLNSYDPSILGVLNTKVYPLLAKTINPSLHLQAGNFATLPMCRVENNIFTNLSQYCVNIAKLDWDAHETSWDFQRSELLAIDEETYMQNIAWEVEEHFRRTGQHICIDPAAPKFDNLKWCVEQYKKKWDRLFQQLHSNEEELNRQFIEIYGLQDELTPEVPLNEITILQQGEITIENDQIKWNDDVIVKQLISYAIGCWMGRYRLDKPGLHIAHSEPTEEEMETYTYNGEDFEIDDDGIIPVLTEDSGFADNACHRLRDFLRIAFGEDNLIDNINFIQDALGKTIETYFIKDFWKDHKKMYQNRPIYWLFSSKKGAFQCLVYMHRMNAYTAERVRSKYLLPHMESLGIRIAELRANEAQLTLQQRKTLDRLVKELDECREYHDRLHLVADQQIAFDLDDGVVVNHAKFGDVLAKIK